MKRTLLTALLDDAPLAGCVCNGNQGAYAVIAPVAAAERDP